MYLFFCARLLELRGTHSANFGVFQFLRFVEVAKFRAVLSNNISEFHHESTWPIARQRKTPQLRLYSWLGLAHVCNGCFVQDGIRRDLSFVVGGASRGSGRPAAFRRSLLRSSVRVARDVARMFCSLHTCIVSVTPVASILAYSAFCLSVTLLIFSPYS